MYDLTGLAAIAALQAGKVITNALTVTGMWRNSNGQLLVHRANGAIYWLTSKKCIEHAITLRWKEIE